MSAQPLTEITILSVKQPCYLSRHSEDFCPSSRTPTREGAAGSEKLGRSPHPTSTASSVVSARQTVDNSDRKSQNVVTVGRVDCRSKAERGDAVWYHLSKDGSHKAITDVRRPDPETSYEESTTERRCIAPTVAQCILALGTQEGTFHIYELEVNNPEPADDSVRDRKMTSEHWISKTVLEKHGGNIPLTHVGSVDVERDMRNHLKCALTRVSKEWEDSEGKLWNIENRVWKRTFFNIGDVSEKLGL